MYIQLYHTVSTNTFVVLCGSFSKRTLDGFSSNFFRTTPKKADIVSLLYVVFLNNFEAPGHTEQKSCELPRQIGTAQQGETTEKGNFRIEPKERKKTSFRTPYGENIKQEGGNVGDFSYWHKKSSACQPWRKKFVACIFYRCIF